MRVIHTISGLGVSGGGPSQSVFYTVQGLQQQGIDVAVLTYQPQSGDSFVANEPFIIELPVTASHFAWSPLFRRFLVDHPFDLYHTQAIWQYPTYITAKIARKNKKPYIITPRGMLYPQALRKSKMQKKLMYALSLKRDLNKAAAVHATCMEEMQHLRALGVKSPIAVIPNPVHITTEFINPAVAKDQLRIGYLGRVHPRKNIERLIYAWDKLGKKVADCELIIIGAGDETYHQFLKNESARLNLGNVIFTGFLSGMEKDRALESLSYLVVPSDFENFGMIVPEALIKGIPVIASKGTPWEELNTHHCGWWVDNDVDTLAATLEAAMDAPEEKRQEMGRNGQKLVMGNYSTEVVAKKMIRLYEWILNGGEKPEFVF
jgi:glycosyltransferase involved in cell wall biosynthesis